jgi:hypothetical protein
VILKKQPKESNRTKGRKFFQSCHPDCDRQAEAKQRLIKNCILKNSRWQRRLGMEGGEKKVEEIDFESRSDLATFCETLEPVFFFGFFEVFFYFS